MVVKEQPAWAVRVKMALDQQGRKWRWLAGEVGVSDSTFRKIRSGVRYYYLDEAVARKIAKQLTVPYDLLFQPEDVRHR